MNYILKIKDLEIPLNIQNYKRSKSIKLYFKEGILKVTKSPYVHKREVDKLIKNNEEKIYEEYKKLKEKKSINSTRWENGSNILYKGEFKSSYCTFTIFSLCKFPIISVFSVIYAFTANGKL